MEKLIINPTSEQVNKSEGYYCLKLMCENCNSFITVIVPQGKKRTGEMHECPECKCKSLLI